VIAGDCKSVQLRSERGETKNGRAYTVTLRVRDSSGNTTRKDFRVSVPISQNGVPAVQDATAQMIKQWPILWLKRTLPNPLAESVSAVV
jgi:hypothetical protein